MIDSSVIIISSSIMISSISSRSSSSSSSISSNDIIIISINRIIDVFGVGDGDGDGVVCCSAMLPGRWLFVWPVARKRPHNVTFVLSYG